MIILEETRILSLLLSISLIRLEVHIVQVVRMGRISIPTGGLLVLGVLLIILAGFNDGIPPSSDWERNLPYFLLIGGSMLIIIAIVFILRERK